MHNGLRKFTQKCELYTRVRPDLKIVGRPTSLTWQYKLWGPIFVGNEGYFAPILEWLSIFIKNEIAFAKVYFVRLHIERYSHTFLKYGRLGSFKWTQDKTDKILS